MTRILALALATSLCLSAAEPARAQPEAATPVRAAIAAVFAASVAAWNVGDLDGFMASYEQSPATIAVGGDKIVNGYAAIRASYEKTFANARTTPMDVLSFEIIECRLLDPDHALVVGRYRLKSRKPGGEEMSGLSSLLFHRRAGHWAIVADHS